MIIQAQTDKSLIQCRAYHTYGLLYNWSCPICKHDSMYLWPTYEKAWEEYQQHIMSHHDFTF